MLDKEKCIKGLLGGFAGCWAHYSTRKIILLCIERGSQWVPSGLRLAGEGPGRAFYV